MSDPKPTGQKIEDLEESIVSSASPFEDGSDKPAGPGDGDSGVSDAVDRDGAEALDEKDGQFNA